MKEFDDTLLSDITAVPPDPLPGTSSELGKVPMHGRKKKGCLKWFLIVAGILLLLLCLLIGTYGYILRYLPDVSDLRSRASQFETMRILDRQENLLYEIVPPEAGRRDYVTLDKISSYVLAAVIAVEDKDYYIHPGFDIPAIVRALFQNAGAGETVSGASTITQQLARNLLLPQHERNERTISRKIKEIILAAEITRKYSKDEILEIYLNENYFGNHAYGIEAAAQTYFRKSAKNLDFAQAAFLVGLPQAPGYYDIFNNRDAVLDRLKTVLLLTYDLSRENSCVSIRSGKECIFVDPLMVSSALTEIEGYSFTPGNFSIKYPHWVNYVYKILESEYGADFLYRSGFTVYTTLDPNLQDLADRQLREQIGQLTSVNAYNGAVVIMNPQSGDILAMSGSPDYGDTEHAGQINMAVSPRQPGSAIKPLIYAAAFEKGWTPATLIWDVETDFSPTGREEDRMYSLPYHPQNYDGKAHGPVLVREALASSLNIPAVKALQYVGVYDDPATEIEDGFIPFAKRFHVDSLDKAGFGLSVALGGGEVTLLEMTNAFAVFANNGRYVPARAILQITDHQGKTVFTADDPLYENVLNPEFAFQISSILSDDMARRIGFGTGSVLNLSYNAAVKTGTTNDYRDNWTVGYNSNIAVGVWVGNADNSPMTGSTGVTGAAPLWHDVMEGAAGIYPDIRDGAFSKPAGITDQLICALSGALPDADCGERKWESFAYYQPPLSENEGLVRQLYADPWSGKLVSAECAANAVLKKFLNVTEPEARAWIKNTSEGRNWAETNQAADLDFIPDGDLLVPPCGTPVLELVSPANETVLYDDHVDIYAVAYALDGNYGYSVEYAPVSEPESWRIIRNGIREPHYSTEKIAEWYLGNIANGDYLLRIRMSKDDGGYYEKINTVHIMKESYSRDQYSGRSDTDYHGSDADFYEELFNGEFDFSEEDFYIPPVPRRK